MQQWTTREELIQQTVTLRRKGMAKRAIGRALGVSRNTVRKILTSHAKNQEVPHSALPQKRVRVPRAKKTDAYESRIATLLETYPDITAQRVFEELREAGYDGGYTAVKDHVRLVRPKPKPQPSLQTPTYGPGEMAESDWSPYTIEFRNGTKSVVNAFNYVLCASRRKNFEFYRTQDLHALMDGHVDTFERFGGLAEQCKYDGQKAVLLRWEGAQPIYNPRFIAFAAHYGFRPHACRPASPNEKPHCERAFWELERSFFNGRRFHDFDDLRAQLRHWQSTVCDTRPHKKLKRSAVEMFAEEREHLLPLPVHPYDTARVLYRLCYTDGFVAWNGNRYAVPYDHITDFLAVRITQREIFVYAPDLSVAACHELAPKAAGHDIGGDLHHRNHGRKSPIDLDHVKKAFDDMGAAASEFFAEMLAASPRLAGYHGRQILLMRQRYSTEDLCLALTHAVEYGALEHKAIARILSARAQPRTLGEYVAEETARRIETEFGAMSAPPDLTAYDRLPTATAQEDECHDDTPPPTMRSSSD